jgi:hypothetical protein
MAGDDTYIAPPHGWTCFHCGEHFAGTRAGALEARMHFGGDPDAQPGCLIKLGLLDQTFLVTIRLLEEEIFKLNAVLGRYRDEDSDKDRQMASLIGDHRIALQREEEKGYARGMADMRKEMSWAP